MVDLARCGLMAQGRAPRMDSSSSSSRSKRALSVSELVRRIRDVLEDELREVWVVGEISNVRRPASGHCYFSLKDRQSQIAAVMFRSAAQSLKFRPEDGLEVIVRGRISLYDVRGDLQLYADWIEPRRESTAPDTGATKPRGFQQFGRRVTPMVDDNFWHDSAVSLGPSCPPAPTTTSTSPPSPRRC